MLRVTVTRESADDAVAIGEVVIGKFAGTEQRGGYAARVFEPASRYSNGIDACFTVRGHERYQPAMALVATVLAAWREARIDEVNEGLRSALTNASAPIAPTGSLIAGIEKAPRPESDAGRAAQALIRHAADPAMAALAAAILAVSEKLD
ncbi:MAG: hypothetical protein GC191_17140 [Azospirillum sp.]|nr:hypothetical protein [Azospirillum sp.]